MPKSASRKTAPQPKIKARDAHSAWAMHYLSRMAWQMVAEIFAVPEAELREAVKTWEASPEGRKAISNW